jgi:hypothetical protein
LAYRPATGLDLDGVLCFKYQRTVAKDNTVKLQEHTLQLMPGPERASYARLRVELQERLGGSLMVVYQGKVIAAREAPPHPATLRARKAMRGGVATGGNGLKLGAQGNGRVGLGPQIEDARPQAGKAPVPKPGPNHPWRKPLMVTKSLNH